MGLLVAVVGSWVIELDEGETEMWIMVGRLSDLSMDWSSQSNCICLTLSDFLWKIWQLHFFFSLSQKFFSSSENKETILLPIPFNRGGDMTLSRCLLPSCLHPALRGPSLNSCPSQMVLVLSCRGLSPPANTSAWLAGEISRVIRHVMPKFLESFQKRKVDEFPVYSVTDLCSLDP